MSLILWKNVEPSSGKVGKAEEGAFIFIIRSCGELEIKMYFLEIAVKLKNKAAKTA